MLSVKGLTKRYGNILALSDVSFEVQQGSVVGFLGSNGAGKTTTMDIICGCAGCDKGSVTVDGYDITQNPTEAKRNIGYLPDEPPIYSDMSVEDYLIYAAHLRKVPGSKVKAKVSEVIERLSIGNVRHRILGNLSKGYRQRVGLAQALVHDPKILILDEPTEGLDPSQIVQIRELIKNLGKTHTILISSHILSEVQNTCDQMIIINDGKIIEQGSLEEISNKVSSGGGYVLKLVSGAKECVEELKTSGSLSFLELVGENDQDIEFGFNGDRVPEDLIRIAMKYGIKQIRTKGGNLEEVFLKLTK